VQLDDGAERVGLRPPIVGRPKGAEVHPFEAVANVGGNVAPQDDLLGEERFFLLG